MIGVAHPKWDERPLLIVVPKEGRTPQRDDVLDSCAAASPNGGCPDDMQLVKEIPPIRRPSKINKLKAARGVQGL